MPFIGGIIFHLLINTLTRHYSNDISWSFANTTHVLVTLNCTTCAWGVRFPVCKCFHERWSHQNSNWNWKRYLSRQLGAGLFKKTILPPPASLEGHTDRSERRNFTEIRYSLFKNNGGKRRVKSRRKVTERLLSMTGGLKGRISMPPPRVWTKHWKQGSLPQCAEDVGTHSSQHLKIHPWEKLNCKLSNFLPVGNQRGKKKKALWMP